MAGRAKAGSARGRKRSIYEGRSTPGIDINGAGDMQEHVEQALRKAGSKELRGPLDTKRIIRRLIVEAGGASGDALSAEFEKLKHLAGIEAKAPFYELREAVTTELNGVGIPENIRRYVTGHILTDIMCVASAGSGMLPRRG